MNAQTGKVGGKARFSRGDAKIWNQGDPEAAADSASLYCPDHGLFAAEKANRLSIQLPLWLSRETLGAKFIIAVIGLPEPKLAPAQKFLPWAARTMARQLGVSSKASKALAICSMSA